MGWLDHHGLSRSCLEPREYTINSVQAGMTADRARVAGKKDKDKSIGLPELSVLQVYGAYVRKIYIFKSASAAFFTAKTT